MSGRVSIFISSMKELWIEGIRHELHWYIWIIFITSVLSFCFSLLRCWINISSVQIILGIYIFELKLLWALSLYNYHFSFISTRNRSLVNPEHDVGRGKIFLKVDFFSCSYTQKFDEKWRVFRSSRPTPSFAMSHDWSELLLLVFRNMRTPTWAAC